MSLDAKIVLLGAQGWIRLRTKGPKDGVGKTSFVVRYVKNTFQQGNASTIGASFLAKKVPLDDHIIRLQIWDTAGQERFRSMAPMYYRSAACGILCYDITSEASFKAMHSWMLELQENVGPELIILIVGTKLDLADTNPSKRQVTFEECLEFADKYLKTQQDSYGRACHEVSAKDGRGVDQVFESITRILIERKNRIQNRYLEAQDRRNTIYVHNEETDAKSGCC